MIDTVIKNGTIIDGTGRPAYRADIAVSAGKITAIGRIDESQTEHVIDAAGQTVTPGFIDIHRHADAAVFRPGFGEAELAQGLTTIVNGNCGLGIAPFDDAHREGIARYLQPVLGDIDPDIETGSIGGYLSSLPCLPLNFGMLVGAGTVRTDLCGYDCTAPDRVQLGKISVALEKALSEGALGVSLGLGYAPECFYTTEQLIRVLSPLKGGSIPITVHMRQEGDGVTESVREMIRVAEALRCPVHISHLKAMGRANWNKQIPEILRLIDRANESGLKMDFDVYPYTAGSTQLMIVMPPEFLVGGPEALCCRLKDTSMRKVLAERIECSGDFDNIVQLAGWDGIFVTSVFTEENRVYCGKSLREIADLKGTEPLDACCDLLIEENGRVTMIDFMADEGDIEAILSHPKSNIISDATYPVTGLPHPRVYGTFSRIIDRYVQKKHLLSLEEAVRKMAAVPAAVLNLKGKGTLAVGMDADLCVFSPEHIKENGDYEHPNRLSTGMSCVLVNGEIAFEQDKMTGSRPGTVVRR